MDLQLM